MYLKYDFFQTVNSSQKTKFYTKKRDQEGESVFLNGVKWDLNVHIWNINSKVRNEVFKYSSYYVKTMKNVKKHFSDKQGIAYMKNME